ncbi:type IV pilus modification PilV family protein [Aquipuribacter sp. SD81]|uniref:type IV pilus modification PilV family protein n=1 Tax=Aquipuribacter sp. SD81 TaxID=3127703 RepID=UPI0030177461
MSPDPHPTARRWLRLPARDDAGFGLVEAVVSLSIMAVLMTSFAFVMLAATRANVVARTDQQASNLLNQQVEAVRSLDYSAVTMRSGDASIAGDPAISGTTYVPNGEALVVDTVGSVQHQLAPITRDNTTYTVRRYVTQPAGQTGYRRVTVTVSWTSAGGDRSRSIETFVTATTRGLPLPRFEARINGSGTDKTAGAGTEVVWGFAVRNLGARDAWNVAASSGTWTYVVDTNADGLRQAGETTLLPDSDGNGVRDTGLIETTQTVHLLAYRTLAAVEASPQTVTFSFTSASQPPPASTAKTVTTTLTVTSAVVVGPGGTASCPVLPAAPCTLTAYDLDQAQNGNRLARNPNPMREGATSFNPQAALYNYSTDYPLTGQGRALANASTTSIDAVHRVMSHEWQVANNQTRSYRGTAVYELWVTCPTSRSVTLAVELGSSTASGGAFTLAASGSQTFTCAGPAQKVGVQLPLSSTLSVPGRGWVAVRASVAYSGATDPVVRALYDTSTYRSTLTMPRL